MTISSTPLAIRAHLKKLKSADKCWKIHNIILPQPTIIEVNVVKASLRNPIRPLIGYYDRKDSTTVRFSFLPNLFFTSKEAAERELVIRKLTR